MHQGGTGGEGRGISTDALGACYVAGIVNDPALFDMDTMASHFADAFITKYDDAGAVQWLRTGGGELIDQVNDIVTDAEGDSYVTGFFTTNGPNPSVEFDGTVLQGFGSTDLFLAKYNSSGVLQWVRYGGGTQAEEGRGVTLSADGHVVVSGFFQGTAVFGNDTLVSAGLSDILLLSFTSDGDLVWSERAGGVGDDKANKLTACANGDLALVGSFQGFFTFGGSPLQCDGLANIFLARFAADGAPLWGTRAGSTIMFAADQAYDIEQAPNGDLVLCGEIAGTADFDGLTAATNGGIDLFIARYNEDGNALWVHHAGGPDTDHAYGVAVDAEGNSYLTGQADAGATTQFDSITLAPFGNEAVFLAKYNAEGAVQWVKRYAAGSGRAVRMLETGCLYFTGAASGTVGQPAFDAVPWQYVDRAIFTARFCDDVSTDVADTPSLDAAGIILFPVPASSRVCMRGASSNALVLVMDDHGRTVYTGHPHGELDVSNLAEGFYVVQVIGGVEGTVRIPLVVAH